jgi:hypothetical protein
MQILVRPKYNNVKKEYGASVNVIRTKKKKYIFKI